MTARDTYQASVVTAKVAKVATNIVNANAHQETINNVGVNAGANPQRGVTAANDVIIRAANVAYNVAKNKAEHDKQQAIQVAKDILRQTDTAPS